MKEFEKVKELILKTNDSIKTIELGNRIFGQFDFSCRYQLIINGELMDFYFNPDILNDLGFFMYCNGYKDFNVEKEISHVILNEYEKFRESRRRSNEEKA